MNFYRDFAYAEIGCDLLVDPPGRDECHDLAFTRRQCFKTTFQLCRSSFLLKPRSMMGMAELNRFKQILLSERLCQELDCSSLHRLHRHWDVTMSGDEDNRQVSFGTCQSALQFESTLAGKPHVEHQASGSFWLIRREKLAHRTEKADP